MLVLSRKPGERILIGNDIVVTVVRFQGGAVRLGIEAPRDFAVVREELAEGVTIPAVSAQAVSAQAVLAQAVLAQAVSAQAESADAAKSDSV